MSPKPKVFKAIITAILGLAVFAGIYFLTYLVVGGVIGILSRIPIVKHLVNLLFYIRGDSPDLMLSLLCPIVAYFFTMMVQASINKDAKTNGLSCMILGIILIVLHVLSFLINLISGGSIFKNITQVIAGIVIMRSGSSELRDSRID